MQQASAFCWLLLVLQIHTASTFCQTICKHPDYAPIDCTVSESFDYLMILSLSMAAVGLLTLLTSGNQ